MFDFLYGNENVFSIIENMLSHGRIPHAIMLDGAKGLGKRSVAEELAKAILCDNSHNYCGVCRSCEVYDAGSHPDIKVIKPDNKSNTAISIDAIRELGKDAFIKPMMSKRKVYIIENAETMRNEAQNAFLKILEEPPQYVVFILLSESSSMLLDTIISRCTIFNLLPPPPSDALKVVRGKIPEKDVGELESVLSLVDNNIGRALSILSSDDEGVYADVKKLLSLVAAHKSYEMLKLVAKYHRDNKNFELFLNLLSSISAVELRKKALGENTALALSKQQLLHIIEVAKNTSLNCKKYNRSVDELLTTTFVSNLNN